MSTFRRKNPISNGHPAPGSPSMESQARRHPTDRELEIRSREHFANKARKEFQQGHGKLLKEVTINYEAASMFYNLVDHLLNHVGGGAQLLYDACLKERLNNPATITTKMVATLERERSPAVWAKAAANLHKQL